MDLGLAPRQRHNLLVHRAQEEQETVVHQDSQEEVSLPYLHYFQVKAHQQMEEEHLHQIQEEQAAHPVEMSLHTDQEQRAMIYPEFDVHKVYGHNMWT